MRRNMASFRHVITYRTRQDACIIITDILRRTRNTWKSILLTYARKMKMLQRRIRKHLASNTIRVEMISLLLETVYPAFFANVQLVLSGKGEDLQNMMAMDTSRLQEAMRSYRRFQVIAGMDSFNVHAQLRAAQHTVKLTSRFFGPAARMNHLFDISLIQRKVILELVFRKRWLSVTQTAALQHAALQLKKFSSVEVKRFVVGGADPLSIHLTEQKDAQDSLYQEYFASKTKARSLELIKKFTRGQVFLPLLVNITAEELCTLYIKITEAAAVLVSHAAKPNADTGLMGRLVKKHRNDDGRRPSKSNGRRQSNFNTPPSSAELPHTPQRNADRHHQEDTSDSETDSKGGSEVGALAQRRNATGTSKADFPSTAKAGMSNPSFRSSTFLNKQKSMLRGDSFKTPPRQASSLSSRTLVQNAGLEVPASPHRPKPPTGQKPSRVPSHLAENNTKTN